jgi:mxaA protein
MLKYLISLMMFLLSLSSFALDVQEWPDIQEGIVSLKIKEPPHRVGYTVGDKSKRHVEVTIKKPYVLIKESLPIPGYERKYKGQDIGIVLDSMNHSYKENKISSILVLDLTYQIFTNNVVAKPGFLPAEYIRLLNPNDPAKKVFKYRIPEYQIAISPLSIFGNIKIEEDMSPLRGVFLMDEKIPTQILKISGIIAFISLIGLLYIYSQYAWLPNARGVFARTHRSINKLKPSLANIQKAMTDLHRAFDLVTEKTLFQDNLQDLYAKNSTFENIDNELREFFKLSTLVFFNASNKKYGQEEILKWLKNFARHCRDCERKLIVDKKSLVVGIAK